MPKSTSRTCLAALALFFSHGALAESRTQAQAFGPTVAVNIRSTLDGRCLDADPNTPTPGGRVYMWDCNGTAWQRWYREPNPGGGGGERLRNEFSNMSLDVGAPDVPL